MENNTFPRYFRILDWCVVIQIDEAHGLFVSHTSEPYIQQQSVHSLLHVPGGGVPVEIPAHEFFRLYADTQQRLAEMIGKVAKLFHSTEDINSES